ncbi:MAG TPA: hypothetical protein ENI64_01350, partial [Gammaproteobacteria bacterium]|nr:hypothetical protein [Gammaproteobacteria bacterium]
MAVSSQISAGLLSSGHRRSAAGTIYKQVNDGLTDLTRLHELNSQRYPFLLQSMAIAPDHDSSSSLTSRYDILFAFPGETLKKLADGSCVHSEKGRMQGGFLDLLDQHWLANRTELPATALPFSGGWFLYLGYELAGEIETGLKLPVAGQALPVACAVRIPAAIIRDRVLDQLWLVAEKDHADLITELEQDISQVVADTTHMPGTTIQDETDKITDPVKLNEDQPDDYLNAVKRIKEYIFEGDVFQVNLSR